MEHVGSRGTRAGVGREQGRAWAGKEGKEGRKEKGKRKGGKGKEEKGEKEKEAPVGFVVNEKPSARQTRRTGKLDDD